MSKPSIDALKQRVEQTFGHRILTAGDCLQLCEAIKKHHAHTLNINTLRRCFGLVKTAYQPSVSTLNILAQYCGYTGYTHFDQQHSEQEEGVSVHDDKKLLNYLVSLFRNTEVNHQNDASFLNIVKQTILFLNSEPHLIRPFQQAVAGLANGQKFYFEQFVNIDALASYYGEGLVYYLAEKKTPRAQLFGHALLTFKCWLTGDGTGLIKNAEKVLAHKLEADEHPYVAGQYFAVCLFKAAATGDNVQQVANEARYFYRHIKPSKENYRFFPGFEMVLADALILVSQYEEALYYLEAAFKKREKEIPAYMDERLYHSFRLYYAVALAGAGQAERAEAAFQALRESEFYFLRKNYLTLYSLLFKKWSGRQVQKTKTQIDFLVQNTGFSFFATYSLGSKKKAGLGNVMKT